MPIWIALCLWIFHNVKNVLLSDVSLINHWNPQNCKFAYFAKCVFFWQYCISHMQSPKQFSPVMQRATFGLLILRKAIFWEPWQNVFSGHENEAKNANFQVRKTYKFAKSKNGTRVSFGNSKIILVEVQRWFFVTIKLIFECSFNFEACMFLYMGFVSQFFTLKRAKMV